MKLQFSSDICTHYVTAIEYGDFTGLDDKEQVQVESFLSDMPANCVYQWPVDGDTHFMQDDITGMMADCVTVEVYG
jgi:hypothetical protein